MPDRLLESNVRAATLYWRYRRRALWLLYLPMIMILVAFLVATWIVIQQPSVADFTGAWKVTGFVSYAYLVMAFLYAPAYLAGLVWFLLGTRNHHANLKQRLMLMPVVSSFFVWCPVMLISAITMEDRVKVFIALIPVALVVGFIWALIVRMLVSYSLRNQMRDTPLPKVA